MDMCKGCDIAEQALAVCEICQSLESAEKKNKNLQAELDKYRWIPVEEGLPDEAEPKNRAKRLYFQQATHNIWSVGYDYENYRWPPMPKSATHYMLINLPTKDG